MSIYSDLILAKHPVAYWRLNDKGKNLLTNSGFENGSTGWVQWFHPNQGAAIDSSVFFEGSASARVGPITNGLCSGWQETVSLQVGTYVYSAMVKTSADFAPTGAPGLSIEAGTGVGTNMGTAGETPNITANMDWTRIRHSFTVTTAGTFNFEVVNTYGGTASGTIWFDNLQLEAGTLPTTYSSLPYSSSVVDLTGNGHAGTIFGAVSKEVAGAIIDGDQAMAFDGSTGYILVPASSGFIGGIQGLFLKAWIRRSANNPSAEQNIIEHDIWSAAGTYNLTTQSNSRLTFNFPALNAVANAPIYTPGNINDGKWHLAIGVLDVIAQTATLYWDGIQAIQKTGVTQTIGSSTAPIYIGSRGGTTNFWSGGIDEPSVGIGIIPTPAEIFAWYQAADTTEFKLTNYTYSRDGGRILTRDGVGLITARDGIGMTKSRDGIGVLKTR